MGLPFMPWQRHVVDVALEVDPKTGRLVYRRIVLTVPRQSGKTTLLLALFVHRALAFSEPQVMAYAAQSGVDARKKLIDEHLPILKRSPFKPLFKPRLTSGHEAVLWQNGSRHILAAGLEDSGHGATLDLGVVDEAFAQPDARLEQAFSPAMITRPEPQLWFVSTAGKSSDAFFRQKVDSGRDLTGDVDSGVAFFEWSAPDGADPSDRDLWRACMPALGHTITETAIAAEFLSMETDEFRRAYLNQWVDKGYDSPIAAAWPALRGKAPEGNAQALAVDMTWDREWVSLAAGMRGYVDIVEHRNNGQWVVDACQQLQRRHGVAVWVHPKGPAAPLIAPLREAGVRVTEITSEAYARACGGFYDAALQATVHHGGHPALDAAVSGAVTRGGESWVWDRKHGSVISPLVAATLAWHGANLNDYDVTESVW